MILQAGAAGILLPTTGSISKDIIESLKTQKEVRVSNRREFVDLVMPYAKLFCIMQLIPRHLIMVF